MRAPVDRRPGSGLRVDPAVASLLVAVTIWGATFVVTRSALDEVGPLTLLLFRFITAFACLAPFARRQGFRAAMILENRFVVFGFTGMVLHLGLENLGLRFTSASSASLIVAGIPATTALMSAALLKERISRLQIAGIGLSIAGVLLITQAHSGGSGEWQALGDLLVFGGVVAWALFTIQGRRMGAGHSAIVSTTAASGAAVLMLVPISLAEMAVTGPPQLSLGVLGAVAYLGIGGSAVAYLLWNHALTHVDASVAAPFTNLVPVIGVVLAVMLGESTSPMQLLGGAVVAAGVWLSQRGRRPVAQTATA